MKIDTPKYVYDACRHLKDNGFQAYVVGGALRDSIIGKEPKDWDIATDAVPDEIESLFESKGIFTLPTGKDYGTITVFMPTGEISELIEITTYRGKENYSAYTVTCTNCQHPQLHKEGEYVCSACKSTGFKKSPRARIVNFGTSIYQDISYRDFTMNAMAYDPIEHSLIDEYGGAGHIKAKLIQAVGYATLRFIEDPLRMLRAIRFSAQLGFSLELCTRTAIFDQKHLLEIISKERIRSEFDKILICSRTCLKETLFFMADSGALHYIIPELCKGIDMKQCGSHIHDVFTHNVIACTYMQPVPTLRLAGLLHDIGKPYVVSDDPDSGRHFYQHEYKGEVLVGDIMKRLRYSKDEISRVKNLVRNHMWAYNEDSKLSVARRLIRNVGYDNIEDIIELRLADRKASGRKGVGGSVIRLTKALRELKAQDSVFSRKDLKVSGYDIIELGIKPGPAIGNIIDDLLELVTDDVIPNEKEALINFVRENKMDIR